MTIILNDLYSYNSSQFSYHERTFVTEASDLSFRGFKRIYDDACDVGIAIRSVRTGVVIRYYLDAEDRDSSGEDITGWRLKPIAEDERRYPSCRGTSVLIIND